jgi:hypothetical protein
VYLGRARSGKECAGMKLHFTTQMEEKTDKCMRTFLVIPSPFLFICAIN